MLRGSLQSIFWRDGISHPTWCWRIVKRIARRRAVSFAEIDHIREWYHAKHASDWPSLYTWTERWAQEWRRYGSVLGGIDCTGWFEGPTKRGPLYCRLENGRRVDSQHCRICGRGINPVWNGAARVRSVCKQGLCRDVWQWQVRGCGSNWYRSMRWRCPPELRPALALFGYLEWLMRQPAKERLWPNRKNTSARPKGSARCSSTRCSA